MFSIKKMLKKAFKAGATAGITVGGLVGVQGGDINQSFWAAVGSAVLAAVFNVIKVQLIDKK